MPARSFIYGAKPPRAVLSGCENIVSDFIVRSLDDVLHDDQDAPLSGIDDPQQGRSGVRSDSGTEVFQTLQPKAHHDKGNWPPGEGCECLAQVRFCLCPTGDAGDVVDVAGKRFLGTVEVVLLEFIEGFDSTEDRTMRVMDRNQRESEMGLRIQTCVAEILMLLQGELF